MTPRTAFFLSATLLATAPVYAQSIVWRCQETDGSKHYTNVKKDTEGKNCAVVSREVSVVPIPMPKPIASPASFPRVDADTQRSRDTSRRRILEDELTTEEKQLADARDKLNEQEGIRTGDEKNYSKVQERLQPYQETVSRHERNVNALKRELANLK